MVFFKTQFAANASVVRHCRKSIGKKPGGTTFKVKAATDLDLGVVFFPHCGCVMSRSDL